MLYRDSENSFQLNFVNASGNAFDVSAYDFRMEISEPDKCVTLTMNDGISFATDGTDGVVNIVISKSRINQFCTAQVGLRLFNDAGSDPVLTHEGFSPVKGKTYA